MLQLPARSPHAAHPFPFYGLALPVFLLLTLTSSLLWMNAAAAPGTSDQSESSMQNVDYLGTETAGRLGLDFSVLVPPFVPAPFGGEPDVRTGGGSYSLYWMISADTPTFLYVTGDVGGSLPAGSQDDFNNELTINAEVQGFDAVHDVTSTYDSVWWIANGVLYSVQSRNLSGTDTLSVANSLIALVPPPPATEDEPNEPEPDVTAEPADPIDPSLPGIPPPSTTEAQPTLESEEVTETTPATEAQATTGAAPTVPVSTPSSIPTEQSDVGGSGATVLDGTPTPTAVAPVPGTVLTGTPSPASTPGGAPEGTPGATPDGSASDGTGSPVIASDGTGGAPPPTTGSDGTGGTSDLSLVP